jgi:cellulose synthase operon protein C
MPRRIACCIRFALPLAVGLLLDPQAGANEADDQYAVAAGHYAAQRWGLAVDEFRGLIKDHPDDPKSVKATFFLGEALVQLRKYDEARAEFQRFLARDPESPNAPQALFRAGESALLAGNRGAAREALEQFCAKHSDDKLNSFALMYLGQIAAAEKDWATAAKTFAKLLEAEPSHPLAAKIRYQLADAQFQAGDFAAAIATLESTETSARPAADGKTADSPSAETGYLLALAYQGAKRDAEALAVLDKLSRTATGEQAEKIKLARASSLVATEKFAAAADLLEAYLNSQPNGQFSDRALGQLAVCQLHTGDNDKAAATFDRLLERLPAGPAAVEAAWNRGQVLERLKRFDAALASYQGIIDKHASSERLEDALLAAARLHSQLHQDPQAIELYERFLRERSASSQIDAARYGLAWALRDAGKRPESDEQFQKLHDDFRTSRFWNDTTFRLADDAFQAKKADRAEQLVEELIAAKPADDILQHALYLEGQLAAAAEKWDRVATVMAQLAHDHPDSPLRLPAEYWVAEAAYRQNRFDEAGKRFAALGDQIGGRKEKWLAMIPLRQAQVLAQQKRWADALAIAERIEAEWPDFSEQYEVDYLLGRAAAAQADFEAARKRYLKVVRSAVGGKTETAAMAQWMIGESYFHQENYEAAVREYLRVEILYPYPRWQAAALLQAGKCQETLGRWKDAAELYARLIKVYSNTEFTEEATRRLHDVETRTAAEARRQAR